MASLNSEMNLGRNHSEFNINSIQSRPVPRGRKHVAALYHTDSDHEDTDDEDEILNESAVGAELYNVYNAPQMNESNPMFFERRAGGPQRSATNYVCNQYISNFRLRYLNTLL